MPRPPLNDRIRHRQAIASNRVDSPWFRLNHEANGNITLAKYLEQAHKGAMIAATYDAPMGKLPPKIYQLMAIIRPSWEPGFLGDFVADQDRALWELRLCIHSLAKAYGAIYDHRRRAEITPVIKAFYEFAFRRLANLSPTTGMVQRATKLPVLQDYAVDPASIPTHPYLSRRQQRVAWHHDNQYEMVRVNTPTGKVHTWHGETQGETQDE